MISIYVLLPLFTIGQQNLVSNGSFEEMTDCPTHTGQWGPVGWKRPNGLSTDYFHSCAPPPPSNNSASVPSNVFGYQHPYEGAAYIGIVSFCTQSPETKEYIQTQLSTPLAIGVRYLVSFYACAADRFQYAISTLGAALTVLPPPVITVGWPNGMLDAEPQILHTPLVPLTDTAKWVHISDTVLANGGERYITIGNFELTGESDTFRFNPDQPPIGLVATTCAYYYIDDVSVVALDTVSGISESEQLNFSVYPNPSNGRFEVRASEPLRQQAKLIVYDTQGRALLRQQVQKGMNTTTVNSEHLAKGVYTLRLLSDDGSSGWEKVVVQ